GKQDRDRNQSGKSSGGGKYTRFFVNHGTRTGLNPKALINLINEHLPEFSVGIGKIEIQNTVSFFEVDSSFENEVTQAFKQTPYRGLNVYPDKKADGDFAPSKG